MHLDVFLYLTLITCLIILLLWFTIWITGIQTFIVWIYSNFNCMETMFVFMVILITSFTLYIYNIMLDSIDQTLLLIKADRNHLLQQYMDLIKENNDLKKENKDVKLLFKKIINDLKEEKDL